MNLKEFTDKSKFIREDLIRVAVKNNKGHIQPSLSCVEILVYLFYELKIDPMNFVLSKSHGCYAYYAILCDLGFIPKDVWEEFRLPGCVERNDEYKIPASCGSLGHGVPIAVGMAFADRSQNVYCIVGDGELQEGSCWEAIQFAAFHKLTNFCLIVDDNKMQAIDWTNKVLGSNWKYKLSSFGLLAGNCDGHDFHELNLCFKDRFNLPYGLVCDTTKGLGLPISVGKPDWHYRVPNEEQLNAK